MSRKLSLNDRGKQKQQRVLYEGRCLATTILSIMRSLSGPLWPMTMASIVLWTLFASRAACSPVRQQIRALRSDVEERYGISMDLSQCLEQRRIDFVDAMRNDTHVYFEASQGDNLRFHWHPLAIVFPKQPHDVSEAVKCAKQHGNVQTVARSGAHSFAGFSSGGQDRALIVDFRDMASIVPDTKNSLVHIEPGARLGDVVKSLWSSGKQAMPHGTCPTVGVGGHTLCGGVGPTSRKWGMAMDNMVEAEVILADGSIVHASQHENMDLWWALRGAGSFYGLVTRFTFNTYDADFPMTEIRYRWERSLNKVEDVQNVMQAIQAFGLEKDLPAEFGFHIMVRESYTASNYIFLQLRGIYMGDKATYQRDIGPRLQSELGRFGAPLQDEVQEEESTFFGLMEMWDDFGSDGHKLDTQAERKMHNNFVTRTSLAMGPKGFSQQGFSAIVNLLWQGEVHRKSAPKGTDDPFWSWTIFFELFGGPNNRMNDQELVDHSAMAHRDGVWLMQASVGTRPELPLQHDAMAFLHRIDSTIHKAMQEDNIERMGYSCYIDSTLDDWAHLYYGKSLPRMVELKKKLDPTNLFRTPQSLIETPPAGPAQQPWLLSSHPLP